MWTDFWTRGAFMAVLCCALIVIYSCTSVKYILKLVYRWFFTLSADLIISPEFTIGGKSESQLLNDAETTMQLVRKRGTYI